jgi:hypothetical protein
MHVSSFFVAACFAMQAAYGATVSYAGNLASPEDASAAITVNMAIAGSLDLQTWGFGGGINAASTVILAGGFDPFVGVFAGTGPTALFIDGTSDVLSNYSSFEGCPPAGLVDIGGAVCGDVYMSLPLAAGTYTVLLTDGLYIPAAVFEINGMLGDGFFDFTGGAFQTCNGSDCVTDTANWALDITTPQIEESVPEPAGWWLCGMGLIGLSAASRRRPLTGIKSTKLNG